MTSKLPSACLQNRSAGFDPMHGDLYNSNCSTAESSFDQPRHRWYVIKEGFSPSLVETAVRQAGCEKSDCIIDPFCGSGTVPVAGALKKHRVVGVEVNPFLRFVSRTKLIQCSPKKVETSLDSVLKGVKRGACSDLESFSTFSETKGAKKWLFDRETLRAFEGGWRTTESMPTQVRHLLQLSLVGAAMDNCNAVPDGKCLRYRKDWRELRPGRREFATSLEHRVTQIMEDLRTDPIQGSLGRIMPGDAREVLKSKSRPTKFRLCVTSPPYLNSFDYTDVYRPELFLSKRVTSAKELRRLRFRTVRSHVQARWPAPTRDGFGPLYESTLREIRERHHLLWDERLPLMIQAYFEDVEQVFSNLLRWAASSAGLWFIVSTSAYAGVEIPVDLIAAHVGEKVGWSLREIKVIRRLRSSGQHTNTVSGIKVFTPWLRESVVIFEKRKTTRR